MKVWIDLHNSPHPLLFAPIARRLEQLGHEVAFTVRDNAQTLELARARWPAAAVIGSASPPSRSAKVAAISGRITRLGRWAKRERPDVALSHNSYAQLVAARLLGIPGLTAMDYEHQPANHLAFRVASRVLIPEALPVASVRRQGASAAKTSSYPGLKEEIYLGDFAPDPEIVARLGIDTTRDTRLVVTRPPPSGAAYHQFENPLYLESLRVLGRQTSVRCVVLTRTAEQRRGLSELGLPNLCFPSRAVDARSLMYVADLVVGAGGTMTREAALLGIPTYGLFAGRASSVDEHLVRAGMLTRVTHASRLENVAKRTGGAVALGELRARSERIVELFAAATVEVAALRPGRRPPTRLGEHRCAG